MLKFIKYLKKRLFCKNHEYYKIDEYFGDAINHLNGARSLWLCAHCKKPHFSPYLNRPKEGYTQLTRESVLAKLSKVW